MVILKLWTLETFSKERTHKKPNIMETFVTSLQGKLSISLTIHQQMFP